MCRRTSARRSSIHPVSDVREVLELALEPANVRTTVAA